MIVLKNEAGYQAGLIETTREYFEAVGVSIDYDGLAGILMDGEIKALLNAFAVSEGKNSGSMAEFGEYCSKQPYLSVALAAKLLSICDGNSKHIARTDSTLYWCASLCLSTLNSAYRAAKKANQTLVISGRDGFLFWLGAKMLGIKCIFLPGWSSNTHVSYPYKVIKDLGIDPYFVDTGYKGSLFLDYEKHRKAEEGDNRRVGFVLISANPNSSRGKDAQSRLAAYSLGQNVPLSTQSFYKVNDKAASACAVAECLSHPVDSGNENGINLKYDTTEWNSYNERKYTIIGHLIKVIVIHHSMNYIVSNKKGWR